jgi:diguanylate cyclase (GGDEF)-like protein
MSRVVRRVWALNAALIAAAAVLFFGIVVNLPAPPPNLQLVPWWALAILFFISEIAVVHVQIRQEANTFSLNELPLIAGLYFTSPVGMVAAQALGAAVALAFHRRQPPLKLFFNIGKLSLEAAVAQVIFHWVVGAHTTLGIYGWLGGLAAIAVVDTLGCLVVQTVITLTEGRPRTASIVRAVYFAVAVGFTSGSITLLGVTVIARDPNGVWLLLIPAGMLFIASRALIGEQGRQEQIGQLYEANRVLLGAESMETAMMQLLEHVRTMFRADVVEIILLTSSGGEERAICSRVGPGDDTVTLLEVAVDPMQQALAALPPETRGAMLFHARSEAGLPARLTALGVRDALVSPLGVRRVIGTIMVANRLGDVRSFNDKDRDLFDTLSGQIALSLDNGRLMQALAGEKMETARFERRAFHDPLTQLANRDLFNDRVRQALARRGEPGRTVAVMYLDLDDFKTVNDSLGHAAGDALLVQVAERLRNSVRPDDTVARLGGDEFAILMEDVTSEAEVTAVAKRILDSLNTPFDIAGEVVWAKATIGIARVAPGQIDLPDLLRRADLAMYTAKGEGKGRYAIFSDRMRMSVVKAPARSETGGS